METKQKKKICLITNWYPTEGNPEQGLFFREQALALSGSFDFIVLHYEFGKRRFRHRVEVELVKKEQNIKEYNVTVLSSVSISKLYDLFSSHDKYEKTLFNKLCDELKTEEIDCFYCVSAQREGALTQKIAMCSKKPYVVSEHGPVPWLDTIVSREDKKAIEDADLMLVISNDKIRQIMMQGIKPPKYCYVGNLVDEKSFTYSPEKHEVTTFISVGAYVFYKNYDMMIDVFDHLMKICSIPFRLMIVGYKANKGYSRNAEELENRIRESRFSHCVEMIPRVPHEEMAEYYNRADAFIMTSVQEGQPVSAIEAACCGLPVFSTRCGGVEDYVDDEVGRIVDILDSGSLAGLLKDYLEKKITFDPLKIRNTVIDRFGNKAFCENMERAFCSVMK